MFCFLTEILFYTNYLSHDFSFDLGKLCLQKNNSTGKELPNCHGIILTQFLFHAGHTKQSCKGFIPIFILLISQRVLTLSKACQQSGFNCLFSKHVKCIKNYSKMNSIRNNMRVTSINGLSQTDILGHFSISEGSIVLCY